jgi:hypothetical protein
MAAEEGLGRCVELQRQVGVLAEQVTVLVDRCLAAERAEEELRAAAESELKVGGRCVGGCMEWVGGC